MLHSLFSALLSEGQPINLVYVFSHSKHQIDVMTHWLAIMQNSNWNDHPNYNSKKERKKKKDHPYSTNCLLLGLCATVNKYYYDFIN